MFYFLFEYFYDPDNVFSIFRLFKYLSFRTIFSAITAFLTALLMGPAIIRLLKRQDIRDTSYTQFGLPGVAHKSGTPTMGGLLIIVSLLIPAFLWCNLSNRFIQMAFATSIWFGLLGGLDDYLKLTKGKKGLAEKYKYLGQIAFGILFGTVLFSSHLTPYENGLGSLMFVPFLKSPLLDLGFFYFIFVIIVIVSSTNAVNLTDGLDGLAIVPVILVSVILGVFAYIIGNVKFTEYLHYQYIMGAGELTVFCSALAGAGIGFLWFNSYPAQLFMGDIGSLALGGILGSIAVMIKQEFVLMIAGGIFVIEAFSVLLQKYVFVKFLGKRLFFRAPLHDSLKYKGWAEPKVVVRYWILAVIFALISLSTLKLR